MPMKIDLKKTAAAIPVPMVIAVTGIKLFLPRRRAALTILPPSRGRRGAKFKRFKRRLNKTA